MAMEKLAKRKNEMSEIVKRDAKLQCELAIFIIISFISIVINWHGCIAYDHSSPTDAILSAAA